MTDTLASEAERATLDTAVAIQYADFADLNIEEIPAYWDPTDEPIKGSPQRFFERAVNAAVMAHSQQKGLSAPAILSEDPQLPLEQVRQLLETPKFERAMEARGIPAAELNYLTDEMMSVLNIITDVSLNMTERKRVESLGVKWQAYRGWLQYEPFRRKYREVMDNTLKLAAERNDLMLAQLGDAGNLNAIIYTNEMTGKYVRGAQEQAQVGQYTQRLMSILMRNIKDPDLLLKIADELEGEAVRAGLPVPPREIIVDAELVGDE